MTCPKCGFEVPVNMHFCGGCGAEISAEIQENQQTAFNEQFSMPEIDEPVYNPTGSENAQQPMPEFGTPVYNQNNSQSYQQPAPAPTPAPEGKPDSLVNAMSFFYPIFGLILYFVDKDKRPVQAKAALKWAIISAVCYVVFFGLYFAAFFGFAFFAGMAEMGMMI